MGEQIAPIVNQWRLIETAPKQRKIIVHYLNEAGRHRTVMACYYGEKSLEMHDDYDDVGTWDEESGTLFADAGWYEEHDSDNPILPLGGVPTHWMPLPEPPATTNPTPEHQLSAAHAFCGPFPEQSEDERTLRFLLALRCGEPGELYGDDGELQLGGFPYPIDFRRDSVAEIRRKLDARGMANLIEQQRRAADPTSEILSTTAKGG